jgi:hypothetical protein
MIFHFHLIVLGRDEKGRVIDQIVRVKILEQNYTEVCFITPHERRLENWWYGIDPYVRLNDHDVLIVFYHFF